MNPAKKSITFVTSHPKKAEQLSYHLNRPVMHQKLDLVEIQSLDSRQVAEQKAREAYRLVKSPVLVEDTSLRFHALGQLPGPLIKWFFQELGTQGLCNLLNGYPDRTATAGVQFTLFDGEMIHTFTGQMAGTIAPEPRGEDGFGWDSIFIPEGYTKTWGEMNLDEQSATSMRRIALKQLEAYLND